MRYSELQRHNHETVNLLLKYLSRIHSLKIGNQGEKNSLEERILKIQSDKGFVLFRTISYYRYYLVL